DLEVMVEQVRRRLGAEQPLELGLDPGTPVDQRPVAVECGPPISDGVEPIYSRRARAAARRRCYSPSEYFARTIDALWPPKPNEFETPTSISASRASLGM